MKAAFKLLSLVMVLTGLTVVAVAQDFICTTNNGTITILHYSGSDAAIVIPNTINGLPVVGLGDLAFAVQFMTSVTIPGSVTNLGNSVFLNSGNLVGVYLLRLA